MADTTITPFIQSNLGFWISKVTANNRGEVVFYQLLSLFSYKEIIAKQWQIMMFIWGLMFSFIKKLSNKKKSHCKSQKKNRFWCQARSPFTKEKTCYFWPSFVLKMQFFFKIHPVWNKCGRHHYNTFHTIKSWVLNIKSNCKQPWGGRFLSTFVTISI